MSINIKVRYRALMTHGLSYDIETRNTNLTLKHIYIAAATLNTAEKGAPIVVTGRA